MNRQYHKDRKHLWLCGSSSHLNPLKLNKDKIVEFLAQLFHHSLKRWRLGASDLRAVLI